MRNALRNSVFGFAFLGLIVSASAQNVTAPYGTPISGTLACGATTTQFNVNWVVEGRGSCPIEASLSDLDKALKARRTSGNILVIDSWKTRYMMPFELKGGVLYLYPWRKKLDESHSAAPQPAPSQPVQRRQAVVQRHQHVPVAAAHVARPQAQAAAPTKLRSYGGRATGSCCSTTWNVGGNVNVYQ